MRMYAVKQQIGDLFLPTVKGKNSKAELADPMVNPPRLFKFYRAASQAMHAWARGIQTGHGNWEGPDDPYSSGSAYFVLEDITITPQRHRRLCDVCVVELEIYCREVKR